MKRTIATLLTLLVLATSTADAKVVRVEVHSRTDLAGGMWYGLAGAYEKIVGTIYYAVDPDNPADTLTQFFGIDFSTGVDWNTGINLPALFPSSWKLQPSLGIQNSTAGPFLLRNRNTGGHCAGAPCSRVKTRAIPSALALGNSSAPSISLILPMLSRTSSGVTWPAFSKKMPFPSTIAARLK